VISTGPSSSTETKIPKSSIEIRDLIA
jgi:hypothetical protein